MRRDILARKMKFVRGLRVSPSMEVSFMCDVVASDVNTTTGQNLNVIRRETGLDPLGTSFAKLKEVIGSRLATVPE